MSHLTCPECGSTEHYLGYGLATGGCGAYYICKCGYVLERHPDLDAEAEKDQGHE